MVSKLPERTVWGIKAALERSLYVFWFGHYIWGFSDYKALHVVYWPEVATCS